MSFRHCVAVDLGASSGRVMLMRRAINAAIPAR